MKKSLIILPIMLIAIVTIVLTVGKNQREQYEDFLNNHAFSNRENISIEDLKQIPKQDRPDLAWEQDFLMTMDPALKRPVKERLLPVYEDVKSFKRNKAGMPGDINNSWVERGPDNVGGRVRALMFDPNDATNKKVWAGSVSGGLWYTDDITDENATWKSVDDTWQNLAISSIAYDPSNKKIFYVGTGEGWTNLDAVRGLGIWKTEDGGTTWKRLESTGNNNFKFIQKIIVSSTGKVIAATNAGIFISDNKGVSWSNKESGFTCDIEIAADGTLYAGKGVAGEEGKVLKSINNGETWTNITPKGTKQNRVELALAPSNSKVIYAVAAGNNSISWFKKSTNAGVSWIDIEIPKYMEQTCSYSLSSDFTRNQHWYDLILAVHPTNENIIIAGGIDLNKSTDGGKNWKTISYWNGNCAAYVHADQHAISFRPGNENEAIFGNDGGIAYSTDVGIAVTPKFIIRNKGFNVTQYYACAIHPAANKHYYLGGTQDNGSHKFENNGINSAIEVTGGDGAFCFIDANNPAIQITSYTNNTYYCSTDGGKMFTVLQAADDGSFINPADYDSNLGILYSGKGKTSINRIKNIKKNPEIDKIEIALGSNASNFKVSPFTTESSTVFVGTRGGRVFKITKAESQSPSISEIGTKSFPEGNVSCMELGANEKELLVTFSNYGVESVWYTSDGGTTWLKKEANLPDMPVRWALFNPNNRKQVLLATEVGVWATSNFDSDNPNWIPSNSGLANVRVDMLKIRKSDNQVLAATHGRGLFTSNAFSDLDVNALNSLFTNKTNKSIGIGGTIEFEDLSTGNPESWEWTFEGGTPASSTEQHPIVQYNKAGTFKVSLTVKKDDKTNTKVAEAFVNVEGEIGWITQATAFTEKLRGIDYIDIVDRNVVWANAYDGDNSKNKIKEFTKTIDGGDTWKSNTYNIAGNVGIAMIHALNKDVAWVPVYPNETGADCGIYKTVDGGTSWTKQSTAKFSGNDAFANVVYFWDENTGFCMGDPNGGYFEIYTTTDGGNKWTRVESSKIPASKNEEYGTVGYFCVADDNTVFFSTTKGRIFKSINKGKSWTAIDTPLTGRTKCAFSDKDNGVVVELSENVTTSKVYRTTDGGTNWESISNENVYSSNIKYVPGTNGMYVTTSVNSNKAGISYSVDGGKTWTKYPRQTGKYFLAIDFYDMTLGWVGELNSSETEGGILKYTGLPTMPDFTIDTKNIAIDKDITFTDITISKLSDLKYTWNFGENATPATANTKGPHKVKYSKEGVKTITLTVNGLYVAKKISVMLTAVEDIENIENSFDIYPNPSKDEINIYLKANNSSKQQLLTIYKLNGQLVYADKIQSGDKKTIHLSKYGKGMYLVKTFNHNKTKIYKIIIN